MPEHAQVLIAGYGQMGHAFEVLLQGRATLRIWDVSPGFTELSDALPGFAAQADFLCLCIPTAAHAAVLGAVMEHLAPGAALLSIAKGLDGSGRNAAEMLADRANGRAHAVLGGPMIAKEIIAGRRAYAELGSTDAALAARLTRLFDPGKLQLSHSPHPSAVSWCGVLKNIYAPLIGISDELGWGDNVRGHLIAASLGEMQQLLIHFTGTGKIYGDAGLADFVTTVSSKDSHHYALGRAVARGERQLPECEGLDSLKVLETLRRISHADFPLYTIVSGLLKDPAAVPAGLRSRLGGKH